MEWNWIMMNGNSLKQDWIMNQKAIKNITWRNIKQKSKEKKKEEKKEEAADVKAWGLGHTPTHGRPIEAERHLHSLV